MQVILDIPEKFLKNITEHITGEHPRNPPGEPAPRLPENFEYWETFKQKWKDAASTALLSNKSIDADKN